MQGDGIFWFYLVLITCIAYAADHFLSQCAFYQGSVAMCRGCSKLPDDQVIAGVACFQLMVQLFCHKRHEGMEQLHQLFKEGDGFIEYAGGDRLFKTRFYPFQVPAAEIIPYQAVNGFQRFAETEILKETIYFCLYFSQSAFKPIYCKRTVSRQLLVVNCSRFPHLHQLQRVPYFVGEVTSLFAAGLIKQQVVTRRRGDHNAKANSVCAKTVDEFQQIRRVAQLFTHLPSLLVAHHTGEVYIAERLFMMVFQAGHDHTCHPEENDILPGYQYGSRVVVVDLRVTGLGNAIEYFCWP